MLRDVCLDGLAGSCLECTNQAGIRGGTQASARLTVQHTSVHIRGSPAPALSQTFRGLFVSPQNAVRGRHRRREYQARGRLGASTGAARFGGHCRDTREQRSRWRSTRVGEYAVAASRIVLMLAHLASLTGGTAWQCPGEACVE